MNEAQARAAEREQARLRREILSKLGTISRQSYQTKRLLMVNQALDIAIAYKNKAPKPQHSMS